MFKTTIWIMIFMFVFAGLVIGLIINTNAESSGGNYNFLHVTTFDGLGNIINTMGRNQLHSVIQTQRGTYIVIIKKR